jgi:uncharacterized hydrophobic protein (TIGR00271 family)
VVHLRIVAPAERSEAVLEYLLSCASVINIISLPAASRRPDGDVILCDVAREDASVVLADLRRMGLQHDGSIAAELVDVALSDLAEAAEKAAEGAPADAVVWEELTSRTSESAEPSGTFFAFMLIAGLIAGIGVLLDSPILIVGAMVVGPEFGPIAGFCVAAIQRRPRLAARSFAALAVGFPALIATTYAATVLGKWVGIAPDEFDAAGHSLAVTIASPDWFAAIVGFLAGVAGMLSLSTAKSGALVGVLISVTTVPAAANVGVALAYSDGSQATGSLETLVLNLAMILLGGLITLGLQRWAFVRRRAQHRRGGGEAVVRRSLERERV